MAKTMSVQVKRCQLRDRPTFLGKVVTNLKYGDRVNVAEEKNSWVRVLPSNKKGGWVHVSTLSEKVIILNPGSDEVEKAASSDEIALAGKGFSKQVEEKFKQANKNIDFTWVDKMEKMDISQAKIQDFINKGGLKAEGDKS